MKELIRQHNKAILIFLILILVILGHHAAAQGAAEQKISEWCLGQASNLIAALLTLITAAKLGIGDRAGDRDGVTTPVTPPTPTPPPSDPPKCQGKAADQ